MLLILNIWPQIVNVSVILFYDFADLDLLRSNEVRITICSSDFTSDSISHKLTKYQINPVFFSTCMLAALVLKFQLNRT